MLPPIIPQRVFSPAKVNLFLHILGQADNGYHKLQTVFCLLNWGDWLEFKQAENSAAPICIYGLGQIPLADNLIAKAYRLFTQAIDFSLPPIEITIAKNIPLGGGLGGGSSNAASTLQVLNQWANNPLTLQELMQIGSKLGADVPIFLHGQHAWAEGIGDIIYPIALQPLYCVLILPNVHINTAHIFQDSQLPRGAAALKRPKLHSAHQSLLVDLPAHNHCEAVVRSNYPLIEAMFQIINTITSIPTNQQVRLSGTGSTLFLPTIHAQSAQEIMTKIDQQLAKNAQTHKQYKLTIVKSMV